MPPVTQVSTIILLKPTKVTTIPRETKPRVKSISVAAVRRAVAKQLPTGTKIDSSSWAVTVTPGSLLMKTTSKVSVIAAIIDADKVSADFAEFSGKGGHLSFLVEGLKPGNPVVLCHSFFFQPPTFQMPKEVGVTIEAGDVSQAVNDDPFGDFKTVLIPKGSSVVVTVTADWPFTWFWRETLFATVA